MDKQRILSLLDLLNQYGKELDVALPRDSKGYVKNIQAKRFCERTLQLMIEVCIDICQLLVKELKLGLPDNEETLFEKLKKEGVISKGLATILKNMKSFRNVLIHHYTKIDDEMVYSHALSDRKDFTQLRKEILKFLKKK